MFKEYDVVTLLEDVSQGDDAAKAGETGTIVHLYPGIDAFTVEFNHGVVYECDLLNLRPHQVRLAMKEDFEREKRELATRARAAGRTHNFWLYNSITLTEDVSKGDTVAKAGMYGTVVDVYDNAILVEFNHGGADKWDRITVLPYQARLATKEDFEIEKRRRLAQTVADWTRSIEFAPYYYMIDR